MQPAEATVKPTATAESIRNSRTEAIFYLTLFVTLVTAGFILWDLLAMLPGVGSLLGLAGENTVYATGTMSTVYLALLSVYAGVKEFTRWTSGAQEAEVPQEKAVQFQRGEAIVAFWLRAPFRMRNHAGCRDFDLEQGATSAAYQQVRERGAT